MPPRAGQDVEESKAQPETSLRRSVVRGTTWVAAGFVVSQAIRLGGNLVLTRLLYPGAFGLMALVQAVVVGAQLLSDVGLRGSIVYHQRGEDPAFLNTAWTVQIGRGLILWLLILAFARPMAAFYGKGELMVLLPIVGLIAVIDGFASTARFTLIRRLTPARQVCMDLAAKALSLFIMVAWAAVHPTVWALAAGAIAAALFNTIASHLLIPGYVNRFAFDRSAFKSLIHYGRWVVLGTALTFLLSQGDRMVLGKLLTSQQLGVYAIAVLFAEGILQAMNTVATSILQPLYSRLAQRGSAELRAKTCKARGILLSLSVPVVCALAIFGEKLIALLYDERYWQAGWMLRILSVGVIGSLLVVTSDRVMLAVGDSLNYFRLQTAQSALLVLGITVGIFQAGFTGFLIGLSCARLLAYIPLAFFLRRYGVWSPRLDLSVLLVAAVLIGAGAWLIGP